MLSLCVYYDLYDVYLVITGLCYNSKQNSLRVRNSEVHGLIHGAL